MTANILEDKKRAAILHALARDELKFNDIARKISVKSNELSYHLGILSNDDYINKDEAGTYFLTDKGKVILPYLNFIQNEEIPPVIFCAPVIVHKNKVLFIRRKKEPFKGYLEFAGGKVKKGETLIQAAIRELREETNIIAENGRIICIADILTNRNHHLVGVYVQLDFIEDMGKEGAEDHEIIWLSKESTEKEEKLLDDNKLILKEFLDKPLRYVTILFNEDKNKATIV